NRLRRALARPDTIIVHDPYWTPMAKHADLVFPAATSFERNDIGSGRADARIIAMHQVVPPVEGARSDYDILTGLAERFGIAEAFTEGRDESAWLEQLYGEIRTALHNAGVEAPSFAEFWADGSIAVPDLEAERVLFDAFRSDPEAHPLRTPSGKIH